MLIVLITFSFFLKFKLEYIRYEYSRIRILWYLYPLR